MAHQSNGVSTRERLVASARSLFTAGSYGSIGVQELCEHADVRRGSFYYHFDSKQDLAIAALDADWDAIRDEVFEPAFDVAAHDPIESFTAFQDLLAKSCVKRAADVRVFAGWLISSLPQETAMTDVAIRNRAAKHRETAAAYFESALDRAVAAGSIAPTDTTRAAERILVYFDGVLSAARLHNDPKTVDRMRFELWRLAIDPTE